MKLATAPALTRTIRSPIGPLRLAAENGALVRLELLEPPTEDELALWEAAPARADLGAGVLDQAERELAGYFAGRRDSFSVPLAPRGTPFQQSVWKALLEIPHGETRSYGDIARAIGKPGASRAVGAANGANPIAIIVPCHRVIATGGGLGGYGGGLACKRRLLAIEGARSVER